MGPTLDSELYSITQALFANAARLRALSAGQRSEGHRILNAHTSSLEATAHGLRSLRVPADSTEVGFNADTLNAPVSLR